MRLFPRVLLIIPILFCFSPAYSQEWRIENGFMDARSFNFQEKRLALNGTWLWYDEQLLTPEELPHEKGKPELFPKLWNETRSSNTGTGVATYYTMIVIPRLAQEWAIEVPQLYSSYTLWLNGKVLMENGKVSFTKESNTPQWLPQSCSFSASSDTLRIILQIANFHHHKGGIKDPIYLSTRDNIDQRNALSKIGYSIQFILLFTIALSFLVIYFFYGRKKIIMYFALLCFSWAVRTLFSNEYLITQIMPDFDWSLMVRIEYLMLFFTMIWAILYLGRLFPKESNQIFKYILVTANSLFIAVTVISPPIVFTRWLNLYLFVSGILLLFGAFMVIKALINEQIGSGFLTLCTFLSVLLFSYDIFTYEGFFQYNSLIFNVGYVTLFFLMGIALLMQLNIIKSAKKQTTILTFDEMYKDNSMMLK